MDQFKTLALAMIYPQLPEKVQKKIISLILKDCGYQFSLEDLTEKVQKTPKFETLSPITYKPKVYCSFCQEPMKEVKSAVDSTPQAIAKLYDEHLDNCLIFQVIEKHRKH